MNFGKNMQKHKYGYFLNIELWEKSMQTPGIVLTMFYVI